MPKEKIIVALDVDSADSAEDLVRKLRDELGFECRTTICEGVARTVTWYREQGWL